MPIQLAVGPVDTGVAVGVWVVPVAQDELEAC
jgi:hypothetical protein